MELVKSLQYCFVGCLAAFSLNSVAAQPEYVPGEVLIVPDTTFQAASVQAHGMSIMNTHKGLTSFSTVKVKPGQTVEQAVQALSNTPGILHAEPNYIYYATAAPTDPSYSNYWGLKNTGQAVNATTGTSGVDIDAEAAWDYNTDCSSIIVAVLDTGVDYNHPDLSSVIWSNTAETVNGADTDGNGFIDDVRGWDFVQGDNDPMDFQYHGTHVAGTIGAKGNNGVGGVGVCWNSTIMPLRVLGSTGSGSTADIIAAVDYAVANGAKVINMSLGGTGYSATFDAAIAAANTAGVLVVAAAGNDGVNNETTHHYPSDYTQPNIISVAATDQNDALASFSNYGTTSVDVAAPGVNIYSTRTPARTVVNGLAGPAPCSWDFDDGTKQGWTTSTYDSGNDSGTPGVVTDTVAVTTSTFNSASYSMTDSPAGAYIDDYIYTATSPVCDLTLQQGAVLEFALNLDTEYNFDFIYGKASNDGSTWTTLTGYSGTTSGGWFNATLDMNAYDGVATTQIQWVLDSDRLYFSANTHDGAYVDDVAITIPGTTHDGSEYTFLNGTSMATPHVAGVAALIWANEPTLTVSQLRSRVIDNGDAVTALSTKTVSGRRVNVMMALPLTAPTGLTATEASATTVNLSWTDNSVSEASYQVQRDSGTGYTTIATLGASAESYSDTSAAASTTYAYQVVAVATDGRTSNSAVAYATTPAASSGGGGGGSSDWWMLLMLTSLTGLVRLRRKAMNA